MLARRINIPFDNCTATRKEGKKKIEIQKTCESICAVNTSIARPQVRAPCGEENGLVFSLGAYFTLVLAPIRLLCEKL